MKILKKETEWNRILKEEFENYFDVYYRYNYFKVFKKHFNAEPEAIYWEDKNIKIFWSFLIRNLNSFNWFKNTPYSDLTTPYGYGGPLIQNAVDTCLKLRPREIFLVEDGSKDKSNILCREIAKSNNLIKHLHSDKRLGKGKAIHNGTLEAKATAPSPPRSTPSLSASA